MAKGKITTKKKIVQKKATTKVLALPQQQVNPLEKMWENFVKFVKKSFPTLGTAVK